MSLNFENTSELKSWITVTADENDADYIEQTIEYDDAEDGELISKIIIALKKHKLLNGDPKRPYWTPHNWDITGRGRVASPQVMHGLTVKEVDYFNEKFLPWNEFGVHTIKSIEITTGWKTKLL